MSQIIPVKPLEVIKTLVITSVEMRIISLELGKYVTVSVFLKDEKGNIMDVQNIKIEGEEYASWGEDDEYLIDLCIRKCGLRKSTPDLPESPPVVDFPTQPPGG